MRMCPLNPINLGNGSWNGRLTRYPMIHSWDHRSPSIVLPGPPSPHYVGPRHACRNVESGGGHFGPGAPKAVPVPSAQVVRYLSNC